MWCLDLRPRNQESHAQGAWLAHLIEHATLHLTVVSLSLTLGAQIT